MQRLHVLCAYHVLDTPPEEEYDDITKLAAQICEVPTAMVTLVDEHRQWFKSKVGLSACEAPRKKDSLCAYATRNTEPLVVEDASKDPRFCDNMLVKGEPHVRFYAGAPLLAPTGEAVGTLCVIDSKPRRLNPQQMLRRSGSRPDRAQTIRGKAAPQDSAPAQDAGRVARGAGRVHFAS